MVSTTAGRRGVAAGALTLLMIALASPAAAQTADPNRGRITFTGGLDFANAYLFRGLLRDDTRLIMWPHAEAAVDLHSGSGGVRSVILHLGTWNSLHTGDTGSNGPRARMWYESDVYGTLALGFGSGITLGTTYTAYISPNNAFTSVKELAFKVAMDDRDAPAGIAVKPYGLIAFEFDTAPGFGQADRGQRRGTYMEFGVAPGWDDPDVSLAFPIKVGFSLKDYYELVGVDHRFGFLSLAAVATVPLGDSMDYGSWNLHGGFEFQSLGDTPEAFNRGDQSAMILAVGIGFRY